MSQPLKCVFASSEVAGFAKTGGLADVAAALPRAMSERGHDCIVVMPLYRSIRTGSHVPEPTEHRISIPIRNHSVNGSVWKTKLPGSDVPIYMIAQPDYFERDDLKAGRTFYQYTDENGIRKDYEDNCERYTFFCRAILELLRIIDFWPDVIHANDWHTGLVPVYVRELYGNHPSPALRGLYRNIRTLFTIHNIAYQGLFPADAFHVTGLPWSLFNYHQLEFYDRFNFMKGGLVFSDAVTAVSPTYSREIQTPTYGCGLQGVLFERAGDLHGIVNGVDYGVWNPATDKHIAATYNQETIAEGKAVCKQQLQKRVGLPTEARVPLLGMVSRLVSQKGLDLILEAGSALMQQNVQMVVLGQGDRGYVDGLLELKQAFPEKVAVELALDEGLAHQIEAGSDIYLMPSLFEPCGLNQLYSLKYGTVPVVRETGGLADTVTNTTPTTLNAGTATGFSFALPTAHAMLEAIERAIIQYHTQPQQWLEIMRNGMRQDWSWDKSAATYEALYRKIVEFSR